MSGSAERTMNEWYAAFVHYAPQFLASLGGAVALGIAFWIAALVVRRLVPIAFARAGRGHSDIGRLLGTIAYVTVLTFGFVSALGTLGINISALVAGLGLTGFALGFALRDAISNALAGILILFYRPFRIGDRIAVSGSEGTVQDVNLRYTMLDAPDRRFLLPNSILLSNTVTVYRPQVADKKPPGEA